MPPAAVAVARFASAARLLWLWARLSRPPVRRPARRDVPLLLFLGFTVVFAYNLFFLCRVRHAPATDGSILVPGFIPVATTLLAWPVLGERPSRRTAAGLAVALAGVVVVAGPGECVELDRVVSDALFVGAAASWAAYTLAGRRADRPLELRERDVYATAAGALLLVPVSVLSGGWAALAHAPVQAWASIGYLSLGGTVVGFVAFYEAVRLIGAARACSFRLLVPIFGELSSVLVLGEQLRTALAVGGAIVLSGLWLAESSPRARARLASQP